ncbi:MAG: hypothetical protein IH626_02385 [Rhodospirillales bacterium]|nr:hypothetical protein [Rhodospirillales bacterium]
MTEIALALAMAFFSIMVLTMISMGVGSADQKPIAAAVVAPATTTAAPTSQIVPGDEDMIIVFYRGRFIDANLRPLDPAAIHAQRRVILALDPALPMNEALAARGRLNVENLVVSVLDDRWLNRLKGIPNAYGTPN